LYELLALQTSSYFTPTHPGSSTSHPGPGSWQIKRRCHLPHPSGQPLTSLNDSLGAQRRLQIFYPSSHGNSWAVGFVSSTGQEGDLMTSATPGGAWRGVVSRHSDDSSSVPPHLAVLHTSAQSPQSTVGYCAQPPGRWPMRPYASVRVAPTWGGVSLSGQGAGRRER